MFPILFKIGPVTIYTYGLFVFLGVLSAYFISLHEAKKSGIDVKKFTDLAFWMIVFGFVGARLLYIIVEWDVFLKYPMQVALSRSGFVFFGGLLGAVSTIWFLTRRYGLSFAKTLDIITLSVPFAHALGRLGCFCYGCCYGRPTDAWFGVTFRSAYSAAPLGIKIIPTQLISSIALLFIFFILQYAKKRKHSDGSIALLYLALYGTFRFIIEFFRADPRGFIGIFSTSQIIALAAVAISSYFFFAKRKKCS